MLTLPRSLTSSLAVPMLTTTTNWIDLYRPPSLFFIPSLSYAQHPSSLVPYCSHLPHGGLHIWGFRDNGSAVDVQAIERILLVSIICSFSTGAVGPPKRFQPHLAHQQRCQEWIGRRWIICFEDLVPQRGWLALGNGEGQKNFPRERWKRCCQELCAPSHLFSSITPLTCIVQLEWLTSTPWPNSSLSPFSHSLLPPPLFATELNADKEAWEAPAITVACVETDQQTETAALSMQVNPQAPPSSDVSVHLMVPSLSAPLPKPRSSSTQGRFCTPLEDPG